MLGKPAFLAEGWKGRKGAEFPWEAGKWDGEKGKRSKKRRDRMGDYDKKASH